MKRVALIALGMLALVARTHAGYFPEAAIRVSVNQSKVIPLSGKAKTVSVARPEIAQVTVLSPGQIQVNGMAVGSTSLVVWHEGKDPRTLSVLVTPDVEGLASQIRTLFPGEAIEVSSAGNSILLTGTVSNEVVYDKVLDVAENYVPPKAPEEIAPQGASQTVTLASAPPIRLPQTGTAFAGGGHLSFTEEAALTDASRWSERRRIAGIVDMLKIGEFRQVEVDVIVAEVSLTKLRETGIDWAVFGKHAGFASFNGSNAGFTGGGLLTLDQNAAVPGGFLYNPESASALFSYFSGGISAAAVLRLFENKDAAHVLARPKLLIKNGRAGSFLSGGEFPFPAPQSSGGEFQTVTVEFRPFGVRLEFVPTVTWSGSIDLKIFPEVSEIDPAVSVRVGGISVPGLKVRRSVTRVEMKDSETLVIGGLLDHRTVEDLTKFPFLGDVPILGALFRSTKFRNQETELVFLVTPRIVGPHAPGVLPALPSYEAKRDPDIRQLPLDWDAMSEQSKNTVEPYRRSTSPSTTPHIGNPPAGPGALSAPATR